MSRDIYTRRFYNEFKRCRYVSDFDGLCCIRCENREEYNQLLSLALNSSPFMRSLTPNGLRMLAATNWNAANKIVLSIYRCFCDTYEYEYESYMSHRYEM